MKESKFINQTDKKWLWSHLNNEDEVDEVCKYLVDNELKIEIRGADVGGFNGRGVNVILEGIDLSGNGFCFNGSNLLLHVRYFRKLQKISNTNEFKSWLEKYPEFDLVKRYIIEKDQRWIDIKQIEDII